MSLPAAGWYPDPEGGSAPRWWDGARWAAPAPAPALASYPPPPGVVVPGAPPAAPWTAGPPVKVRNANHNALLTFAVVGVYVVLAFTVHVVFLGIFPVLTTVRSFRAREKLAPVALVATVVAVVLGISAFAHR